MTIWCTNACKNITSSKICWELMFVISNVCSQKTIWFRVTVLWSHLWCFYLFVICTRLQRVLVEYLLSTLLHQWLADRITGHNMCLMCKPSAASQQLDYDLASKFPPISQLKSGFVNGLCGDTGRNADPCPYASHTFMPSPPRIAFIVNNSSNGTLPLCSVAMAAINCLEVFMCGTTLPKNWLFWFLVHKAINCALWPCS